MTQRLWFNSRKLRAIKALDKHFLYYSLQHQTQSVGNISDVAQLARKLDIRPPKRIYRVRVTVPLQISEYRIQERYIASILSAYDDLIENNRRRIQLLEQAARLLYKEWFVRLRFPGHEHVKVRDGVPEGWESKQVIEIADLTSVPDVLKSTFYNEEGFP